MGVGLADVAGADVHAVADGVGAGGVAVPVFDEAVDVDFHAVPVGGDGDGDGLVVAFGRGAEDTGLGIGAVDEDIDEVFGVGADDFHVVVEVDIDLEWGVELRGVEVNVDGGAGSADEAGEVDVDAFTTGGGDVAPVAAEEDVAGGHGGARQCIGGEAESVCGEEAVCEFGQGGEASPDDLLVVGARIFDVVGVGALIPDAAAPFCTYYGADFSFEGGKDTHTHFTHSFFGLRSLRV